MPPNGRRRSRPTPSRHWGVSTSRQSTHPRFYLSYAPVWTSKPETASRLRQRIEAVLDYSAAQGLRGGPNPARWRGHLQNLLPRPSSVRRVQHHPALDWRDMPAFMAVGQRNGTSARALEFVVVTAARSGEVRGTRWGEIDLRSCVWTLPAGRMKASKEHRVPLTARAIEVLGEPGPFPRWCFPHTLIRIDP